MPSFKFLGFTTGSAVALSIAQGAASASAALTWGQPGGGGAPNATFSIARVDNKINAHLIAPCGVFFRAASLSGFNVTEPAGDTNVYDPTAHRITFIWDFGDPSYTSRFTPNIPNTWRNLNVAYGKHVAHVFAAPGNYTVTCWAFDEVGNWGIATYTFQSGGNAGPIQDPNTVAAFAGTKTVCYDPAGDFAGAPSGSANRTNIPDANTALAAAGTFARLLLRRGQTYTINGLGLEKRDAAGLYVGAYGTGAAPVVNVGESGWISLRELIGAPCVIQDIDTIGGWDPTTETGVASALWGQNGNGLGMFFEECTFHRCRFSGLQQLELYKGADVLTPIAIRILNDCKVENWKDYGNLGFPPYAFASIYTDWASHVDALHGIVPRGTSQSPTNFGNTHGPLRPNISKYGYIASSSFFSNMGWSGRSGNYATASGPPTEAQACIRFTDGPITDRRYYNLERIACEGGVRPLGYVPNGAAASDKTLACQNMVFDKILLVATGMTENFIELEAMGQTLRNVYMFRHDLPRQYPDTIMSGAIKFTVPLAQHGLLASSPHIVHNCTEWLQGPTSNIGTLVPALVVSVQSGPFTANNNVLYAPNLTTPIGASFPPFDTTNLAGFQCRYKGGRWNFPPIGSAAMGGFLNVADRRENPLVPGTIQVGNVANNEAVILPYPNYTGMSGGALGQVTKAICEGNSTQRHQVSLTGVDPKRLSDPDLWPGYIRTAYVDIVFEGPQSGWPNGFIRVINRTGSTWNATYLDNGVVTSNDIWMMLDLSDYLMAHRTAFANPVNVPALIPTAGSPLIVANRSSGLWAHGGFFSDYREGVKTPPSGAAQTGKLHRQGAFA